MAVCKRSSHQHPRQDQSHMTCVRSGMGVVWMQVDPQAVSLCQQILGQRPEYSGCLTGNAGLAGSLPVR